jgi:hypothetical protein
MVAIFYECLRIVSRSCQCARCLSGHRLLASLRSSLLWTTFRQLIAGAGFSYGAQSHTSREYMNQAPGSPYFPLQAFRPRCRDNLTPSPSPQMHEQTQETKGEVRVGRGSMSDRFPGSSFEKDIYIILHARPACLRASG